MRGHPRLSAGEASQAVEPSVAAAMLFSSICRWECNRSDPWGIPSPKRRRGQSSAPCQLFWQLVRLFAQITAEESEDELPSREEQGDARLGERDAAEGNNKRAVTEESKGDGQRRGEEAEQPDQTVTKPQVSGDDGGCCAKCGEKISYFPVSVCTEQLCGYQISVFLFPCTWVLSEADDMSLRGGSLNPGAWGSRSGRESAVWC